MISEGTSVAHEKRGYSRGLILGLTMAETLLLLTFCLLIAAGAIVDRERSARETAERRLEIAATQLATERADLAAERQRTEELSAQLAAVVEANGDAHLREEEIRKLVLRKKAVDALAEAGVRPEDVAAIAPAAAELQKLHLADPQEIDKLVAVRKVLAKHGIADGQGAAAALDARLATAEETRGAGKMHDWPPIISMSELDGYHFTTGSAELSEGFKRKLRQKSADIAALAKQYRIDVVEVIGHTDEQPIWGGRPTWTPT